MFDPLLTVIPKALNRRQSVMIIYPQILILDTCYLILSLRYQINIQLKFVINRFIAYFREESF